MQQLCTLKPAQEGTSESGCISHETVHTRLALTRQTAAIARHGTLGDFCVFRCCDSCPHQVPSRSAPSLAPHKHLCCPATLPSRSARYPPPQERHHLLPQLYRLCRRLASARRLALGHMPPPLLEQRADGLVRHAIAEGFILSPPPQPLVRRSHAY